MFANPKRRLFRDTINFAKGLTEEEVGVGAFYAALPMLETEGFFASPVREGGDGGLEFFRSNGGESVQNIKKTLSLNLPLGFTP